MATSVELLEGAILCCPVLFALGLVAAYLGYRSWQGRAYRAALSEWARRRGVTLEQDYPAASFGAPLDGVSVQVSHSLVLRGMGKRRRRRWHHHVVVEIPVPMGDLMLRPHGNALSELIDHVGGQKDVVIGDDVFDRTFVISTAHDDAARSFFTPPVRAALLASLASLRALGLGEVVLARNAVHLTGRGHFPVESLDPAIAAMAQMARACASR